MGARADRQAKGNGNENKKGTCAQKERERDLSLGLGSCRSGGRGRAHVKQMGLTEYFRAGVKSHKSTCQELYKKDRELHEV